jgi:hypothetical protein
MPANYHPLGFDFKADIHNFLESPNARVPKELACALTASLAVSPLVSIIDKAMIQDISSIRTLSSSMLHAGKELLTKPRLFLGGLSFRLTLAVYFGTYAVANLSEAALDARKVQDEQTRKVTKVGAASAANVSLLAWRDSIFARVFSAANSNNSNSSNSSNSNSGKNSAPARRTPLRTIGLFGARDTVTMAATFWAAPKVCEYVVEEYHWDEDKAEILCAFGIPVISQFLTAPLHIHAIDYFHRPDASTTTAERLIRIREEMAKVCFMRGLRILPAFGIGSYSNNKLREWYGPFIIIVMMMIIIIIMWKLTITYFFMFMFPFYSTTVTTVYIHSGSYGKTTKNCYSVDS